MRSWVVERDDEFGVEAMSKGEETIRIGDKGDEQKTSIARIELKSLEKIVGGRA